MSPSGGRQVNRAVLRISGTSLPRRRSRVFPSVYHSGCTLLSHVGSRAASSPLGLGLLGALRGRHLTDTGSGWPAFIRPDTQIGSRLSGDVTVAVRGAEEAGAHRQPLGGSSSS
jgi:hypothetical protein